MYLALDLCLAMSKLLTCATIFLWKLKPLRHAWIQFISSKRLWQLSSPRTSHCIIFWHKFYDLSSLFCKTELLHVSVYVSSSDPHLQTTACQPTAWKKEIIASTCPCLPGTSPPHILCFCRNGSIDPTPGNAPVQIQQSLSTGRVVSCDPHGEIPPRLCAVIDSWAPVSRLDGTVCLTMQHGLRFSLVSRWVWKRD